MPRLATSRLALVACLGAVLLGACAAPDDAPAPDTTTTTTAAAEPEAETQAYAAELIDLTNEARADEGLAALEDSGCARDAAVERAGALVGQEELTHAPLAPVIESCAPMRAAAENLVNSEATPAEVVEAWLDSPGHRANIVDGDLSEIGVGCVPDGAQLLCSQVFLGP